MTKNNMKYRSFDQILNDDNINNEERIKFTRQWLKEEYGIAQYDTDWLSKLSDVHNHDDMPKHFGENRIGSAFSVLTTSLIRLPEGWHLGVSSGSIQQGTPVHPKSETSYVHPENQKVLLRLTQALKNGKLQQNVAQGNSYSGLPTLKHEEIFAKFDKEAEASKDNAIDLEPVKPESQMKTTSVNIDLSSYGL